MNNQVLGRHLLVEFYGCHADILNDVELICDIMKEAAIQAGATVVDKMFRKFIPHGVSGMIMIEESHLSIHTWPEHGYAAVDLFTCGENVDPHRGFELLKGSLQSDQYVVREIMRGLQGENVQDQQIKVIAESNGIHDRS